MMHHINHLKSRCVAGAENDADKKHMQHQLMPTPCTFHWPTTLMKIFLSSVIEKLLYIRQTCCYCKIFNNIFLWFQYPMLKVLCSTYTKYRDLIWELTCASQEMAYPLQSVNVFNWMLIVSTHNKLLKFSWFIDSNLILQFPLWCGFLLKNWAYIMVKKLR